MAGTYRADSAPTQFVASALARYGYRELGPEGDIPVVLLQRFRGTIDDWDPYLVDLLSENRRVILLDNVGVGSSDGTSPSTVKEMGDGLADFLQAMNLPQIDLIGWSMGGFVAQLFALDHPDLVRRVVIAGTGPGEPSIRPVEDQRSVEIRAKVDLDIPDILFIFFPDTDEGRAAGIEVLGRCYHHESGEILTVKEESWKNQAEAISRWNSGDGSAWSRLSELRVPMLVTAGAQDVMEEAVQAFETSRQVNGLSSTTIFSNSGHAFLFQHAERFASTATNFLAGN
ncbi:alpha/beta fold hydrolase [Streptomyces sp. NPDC001978]|uniref:alpha/beta fold hydrolase n=1 Tax=Streptomyces sp. NPDC001978 TaxID=3364627 RepID=UPI0036BC2F4A